MRSITLGRSGIVVSAVGLGGIQFSKINKRQVARIIGTALEMGINFLETGYGYFDSEEKIGLALGKRRKGVVLATKYSPNEPRAFAATIDKSLQRLRAEVIDLYQLHGVDSKEQLERALGPRGAVKIGMKAIRQGKIRSLGISTHSLEICQQVLEQDLFDTIQLPISLINTEVARSGILGLARRKNVGLIAMKPLGGGRITDARLALGYIYRHPRVVPVVGVETPDQVRQLARLAQRPPRLGPRDFERIANIRKTVGRTFCRTCQYCEPCPQEISIYRILYLPVYVKQMGSGRYLGKGVPEWLSRAEQCTACKLCETRCPFGLHIVEGLKESLALAHKLTVKR